MWKTIVSIIIKFIPKKWVKNLGVRLVANLATNGLAWLITNYPEKVNQVKEKAGETGELITYICDAVSDDKLTPDEITQLKNKIKILFS